MTKWMVSLLLLSFALHAEIYKYTDDQGRVHYTDVKPAAQQAETVAVQKQRALTAEEKAQAERYTLKAFQAENPGLAKAPKVVMYGTDWCGHCKRARDYFKKNNIPFVEYDIDKDPAAKARHKALGGTGVPLIQVGDQQMKGFSEEHFNRLYFPPPAAKSGKAD